MGSCLHSKPAEPFQEGQHELVISNQHQQASSDTENPLSQLNNHIVPAVDNQIITLITEDASNSEVIFQSESPTVSDANQTAVADAIIENLEIEAPINESGVVSIPDNNAFNDEYAESIEDVVDPDEVYFHRANGPLINLYDSASNKGGKFTFTEPTALEYDPFPSILNLADVPVPPRHQGWMEKEGHLARTWKRRYFVLDHGFLSYFKSSLDRPPFGEDIKGQLCLAGYRVRSISSPHTQKTNSSSEKLARRRSSRRGSAIAVLLATAGSELSNATGGGKADSSATSAEDGYIIELEFFPQTVDLQILEELRQRNSVLSNRVSSQSSLVNQYETHKLFSFACSSQVEQDSWFAAIHAHIMYMEILVMKHRNDYLRPSYIQPKMTRSVSSSISSPTVLKQRRTSGVGGYLASNISSPSMDSSSLSKRRKSSTQLSSAKWSVFVDNEIDENIKLVGKVEKPNPVGYCHVRDLVLVDAPSSRDSMHRVNRRIFYVDGSIFSVKGEFKWDRSGPTKLFPKATKVSIMCIIRNLYVYLV